MTPGEIATTYLEAFTSGDAAAARQLLADGYAFRGPMTEVDGGDAFISETAPLGQIADGWTPLKVWEDGTDVCVVFDFKLRTPAGAGAVRMSEWFTVEDGLITSSRLVFDTAAFMALMPQE